MCCVCRQGNRTLTVCSPLPPPRLAVPTEVEALKRKPTQQHQQTNAVLQDETGEVTLVDYGAPHLWRGLDASPQSWGSTAESTQGTGVC